METRYLLIKESLLITENIRYYYFDNGVSPDVPVVPLKYVQDKFKANEAKMYLQDLLKDLHRLGATKLLVCDANYFKLMTGQKTIEFSYGQEFSCKIGNYSFKIIPGINYKAISYNPELLNKLQLSIDKFNDVNQSFANITRIGVTDVRKSLLSLHNYSMLTVDIETTGLCFYLHSLYSISFSWSNREGFGFLTQGQEEVLKNFFDTYQGKLVFHNSSFDIKFLIYKLYMKDINDQEGLLTGLHTLCRNFGDTKIIAYLALNSTGKPDYGLKHLALPYVGKYALEDINDVTKVPVDDLLNYNVTDTCATYWVYEKYYPKMVADNQENIYNTLFLPSQKVLIQTELTGVRLNPAKVKDFKQSVQEAITEAENYLNSNPYVKEAERQLAQIELDKINSKLKTKVKTLEDINFKINLNSHSQIAHLLYEVMHLPIIDYTDSGKPSSSKDTIEKLLEKNTNPEYTDILKNLVELQKASKIFSDFIPTMENAFNERIFGSFVLGGTISGRLSSKEPNLQNMPSTGTSYAKAFKACFDYRDGWIMVGSDFNALEDHINALLTKDPNKLAVYTDGYDSHCIRAFNYYGDQMPDIRLAVEGDKCWVEEDENGNKEYFCKHGDEVFKV